MEGDRDSKGRLKKGNQCGASTRWQKGQVIPGSGTKRKTSLLRFVEAIGNEMVNIKLPGEKDVSKITKSEFVARRFWHYLMTVDPLDIQAIRLTMEYLDGKPAERDDALSRTPQENAILISIELEKMNAADGITQHLDPAAGPPGADIPLVADADPPGSPGVPAKRGEVQRRPGRKA